MVQLFFPASVGLHRREDAVDGAWGWQTMLSSDESRRQHVQLTKLSPVVPLLRGGGACGCWNGRACVPLLRKCWWSVVGVRGGADERRQAAR
eukprot:1136284-Pelagomonas_calceolata.AAC.3